jgi:hypothetical protein
MKHSKKEKTPKGFSRGSSNDRKRQGPIMIEEILDGAPTFFKYDLTVREMIMRTDATNESSPVIKRKFKPLGNPSNVLDVLQGVLLIKEGVIGNNVTTGPLQCRCWRRCLTGTAFDKFNEHTQAVGNETAANLFIVEQRLITFFAPREVLRQQTRCIRFHMRKPEEVRTRQCVGAAATLNNTLSKLPPAFDDLQTVSDTDMMDILASKAPKRHKELMTDHGFDPQTATTAEFVEICERAETKEALQTRKQSHDSEDDSSDDEVQRPKKPRKKAKTSSYHNSRERSEFCCEEHGPNDSHNTSTCKVLLNRGGKDNWKKKDASESKHSDCKSKYKKKHAELNLLQKETKKEKAKWTKAYKNLKVTGKESESSDSEADKKATAKTQTRPNNSDADSDSSSDSSSSSDSNSESESGCRETYLLEKKKQNRYNSKDKKCENKPHYKHIDDAINDAYLLSALRKPAQMITTTDEDGQTQKKSKYKKLSPILFVKIECATGKKSRRSLRL